MMNARGLNPYHSLLLFLGTKGGGIGLLLPLPLSHILPIDQVSVWLEFETLASLAMIFLRGIFLAHPALASNAASQAASPSFLCVRLCADCGVKQRACEPPRT